VRQFAAQVTIPDRAARLSLGDAPLDPVVLAAQHHARHVFLDGRHCTEDDLRALAALPNAASLEISGLRIDLRALRAVPWVEHLHLNDPATLDGLVHLQQVRRLAVYHFPKIHDLAPVGALSRLRTLLLSTSPSYDASRKCFEVDSLEPLAALSQLEQLTMRGVVPLHGRLEPLHGLTGLRELAITHVYCFGLEDYARLAAALRHTTGHCLEPFFAASWAGTCRRCGQGRVVLTGPRQRRSRFLCPLCDGARVAQHVAAWKAASTR